MSVMLAETRADEATAVAEAPRQERKRVVIIGGGFAGLAATRALRRADVDIVLIDRRNHHIFQPLLYQVATAVLSPAEIASPIRPPSAVCFGTEHLWNRRCRDPGGPQYRRARDPASTGNYALVVDRLDLDPGQDLDPELREPLGYPAGQRLRKRRQDPIACVEQNDAGLSWIDAAEVAPQRDLCQMRQGPCQFD